MNLILGLPFHGNTEQIENTDKWGMLIYVAFFSSFNGLTHVKKQSIREYYVFESFCQFDQQNARTCVA